MQRRPTGGSIYSCVYSQVYSRVPIGPLYARHSPKRRSEPFREASIYLAHLTFYVIDVRHFTIFVIELGQDRSSVGTCPSVVPSKTAETIPFISRLHTSHSSGVVQIKTAPACSLGTVTTVESHRSSCHLQRVKHNQTSCPVCLLEAPAFRTVLHAGQIHSSS